MRAISPLDAATLPQVPKVATAHDRATAERTGKAFEASFLSVMLGQMLDSLPTDGPFGGGQGEAAMRSFLTEAMARSMTQRGGIGLAKTVSRELLHLQGLSPSLSPTSAAPAPAKGGSA